MSDQNDYVIFSASKIKAHKKSGYWSNETGWCGMYKATRFSKKEIVANGLLPFHAGCDAEWVLARDK